MESQGETWAGHAWTPWVPLHEPEQVARLPKTPGLYRVRPAGSARLAYVGETGRSVRERVGTLRRVVAEARMPFNDPHTAGPCLWAHRIEEGMRFEVSATPFDGPASVRKALECRLLWTHRHETGRSTLANHGRFHPAFTRSRSRKSGIRGARRKDAAQGADLDPPALQPRDAVTAPAWMGLPWSPPVPLDVVRAPPACGLYRLLDARMTDVVYVGQTRTLRNRLRAHANARRGDALLASYHVLPEVTPDHALLALESDLIGAHHAATRRAPRHQFGGRTATREPSAS